MINTYKFCVKDPGNNSFKENLYNMTAWVVKLSIVIYLVNEIECMTMLSLFNIIPVWKIVEYCLKKY